MSGRKLHRGDKVGSFTLIDVITDERWLCQCECGAREVRTLDALRDTRTMHCCKRCHTKKRSLGLSESRKASTRARAQELRSALDAVATPKNLQRILNGRRLDTVALLAELGVHCDESSITTATDWLRSHGCRKSVSLGRNTWEWVGLDVEPKPVPAGPALEDGSGEKRDCRRWTSCLSAFAGASQKAVEGHCPSGCAYSAPFERSRLLRQACDDVSYAQRGANLGGV